jgi:hypothetical protein
LEYRNKKSEKLGIADKGKDGLSRKMLTICAANVAEL